jgi:hypothetical protein
MFLTSQREDTVGWCLALTEPYRGYLCAVVERKVGG